MVAELLADAIDLEILWRMVAVALAYPWDLLWDVWPWLGDQLALAWVWLDSRCTHVAWLQSLAPPFVKDPFIVRTA